MRGIKIYAESLFSSRRHRPFVCPHNCHPLLLPYQPSICLFAYLPSYITSISTVSLSIRISAILYYSHISHPLGCPYMCYPILLPYQPYACLSAYLSSFITPLSTVRLSVRMSAIQYHSHILCRILNIVSSNICDTRF